MADRHFVDTVTLTKEGQNAFKKAAACWQSFVARTPLYPRRDHWIDAWFDWCEEVLADCQRIRGIPF